MHLAELIMNSAIRESAERQTREGNRMNRPLTWTSTEDIAIALADKSSGYRSADRSLHRPPQMGHGA